MAVTAMTQAFGSRRSVNVTFENGSRTVSLCVDNGATTSGKMSRGDVRCFDESRHRSGGDMDVTGEVFGTTPSASVHASVQNMQKAMSLLQRCSRGADFGV